MARRLIALWIIVALPGCTTTTVLEVDPWKVHVRAGDETIATRTPCLIEAPKSAFARGSYDVVVEADGYHPKTVELDYVMDRECAAIASFYGALGIAFIFPAAGALVFLPWCSKFGQEVYQVELEPR